ncbi:MAG: hypothetical protein A2W90_17400 [Bacteroidetes bacterium GWF2_42_66]|nr:MAG: hypothetical protein A2W92_21365 [Bacteroidetes bacterium GWA2_42_15]OFX97672.1 MAG: hypothetical protein A2W89_19535 [Bacteroidetes bacterium GWE2_42_39]OFY46920.1 MAG: hypothetical protein A2W90_17400 [Bacteroidetes bacterium GWF2_42_66]HBL75718.1 hypothetical protein [Prolixibacteraceae bacterium]HCU59559.1 hypothetical protein [Prolixibacteraceae bacterium]
MNLSSYNRGIEEFRMLIIRVIVGFFVFFNAFNTFSQQKNNDFACRLELDKAYFNPKTTIKIQNGEWVQLKENIAERIDYALQSDPDLVFPVNVQVAGTYVINTHVTRIEKPEGEVRNLYIKMQIDDQRLTKRIVSDARNYTDHVIGKFQLTGQTKQLKIWLPKGIRLGYIEIKNDVPPEVPPEAKTYQPKVVPPAGRPRLWVNAQSLPLVKARLNENENRPAWIKVKEAAIRKFTFRFSLSQEIFHSAELEKAVEIKAFYYLMTGDSAIGCEAVRLMRDYLSVLEFGNVNYGDITREIGRSIYTAALVYDWCYSLMAEDDRKSLYAGMMKLAGEMEIGWPPFLASIISGHGNEAQVNRDLLAMSIAVYDENPEPYRYTSYRVLEQLVPMRKFEYQSPRHNQGVDYGAYRLGWEMHAAWLFYRMAGLRVFDDNITNLSKYWLYMRLPDGEMLRDGDMFSVSKNGKPYFWKEPQTMLLLYSYANDPLIKAEFGRQGGLPDDPVLFLLLNDPDLKANLKLDSLPLTIDFGPILGSMIARTGWEMGMNSNDVIAEIKGGGYHFGNHQHADAGAVQFYYKGLQVCDLGLYISYGSSYDFNFNKRSVAHSMMLVNDPEEKVQFKATVNDGGTRFNQRFPETPQETMDDPWFYNGKVLSADFGPSKQKPLYSFFKVDLAGAYSNKISRYTRSLCFLNLKRDDVPAAIILTDDMLTTRPDFKKYWKINTLTEPVSADSCIILQNSRNGCTGKTHVQMLLPHPTERQALILSSTDFSKLYGPQYKIPSVIPEANGYHIMVSPAKENKYDRFLTIFQMTEEETKPLPVKFQEEDRRYVISLADYTVCMSSDSQLRQTPFSLSISGNAGSMVLLTDMYPGVWTVSRSDRDTEFNVNVWAGQNTVFFKAEPGKYIISPGSD